MSSHDTKVQEKPTSTNVQERIRKRGIFICAMVSLVLLALIITLIVVLTKKEKDSRPTEPPGTDGPYVTRQPINPPPTEPPGADGPYQHAVVASDAGPCSEIGRNILQKGGTAVDSAIAALFCIGVYNMHSAGIGGGGFMVVYKKSTKFVEVIDFREEAPWKGK